MQRRISKITHQEKSIIWCSSSTAPEINTFTSLFYYLLEYIDYLFNVFPNKAGKAEIKTIFLFFPILCAVCAACLSARLHEHFL
jgi:hypothetical protein